MSNDLRERTAPPASPPAARRAAPFAGFLALVVAGTVAGLYLMAFGALTLAPLFGVRAAAGERGQAALLLYGGAALLSLPWAVLWLRTRGRAAALTAVGVAAVASVLATVALLNS